MMKKVGISILVVVIAVALGAAGIFLFSKVTNDSVATQQTSASSAAPTEEIQIIDANAYKEEVVKIVNNFQGSPSPTAAKTAYASLLGLRVPGDLRSLHFSLVLYFDAQSKAQQIDLAPLQQLTGGVDWL